jgi:lipopolysaccharide export system permease protein
VLSTLDRYIIKKFLGTFFFILALIMAIAVVFDVSEKTEDFSEMTATFWQIVTEYYVNFVIYYSNFFSGLLIFIAVVLFTSRLAHRSEVIAMLSGGVSYNRFLRPYFISGIVLALVALFVNHMILPDANKIRLAFEEEHIRAQFFIDDSHIHREIKPGTIAYFESFDAHARRGFHFSLEHWDSLELKSKLFADRATYDTITGHWKVEDYYIRTIDGQDEHIERGTMLDTALTLVPSDVGQRPGNAAAMRTPALDAFIAAERARGGSDTAFFELERHQRTSTPFAVLVFTLIGVGLSSRKVRGGTGLHLALGFLIALMYVFAQKITSVAATNAGLPPMVAVWIPNVIFLTLGIYIHRTAPK